MREPRRDDRGATLVEYAMLIAMIALVCILAITFLGNRTNDSYEKPELTSALS